MSARELRRVVYVCTDPGIPVFGRKGASVHVQAILRVLRRRGVEVHLACTRTGGEAPADLSDVVVHALPGVPGGEPRARELAAQASDAAVADVLAQIAADGEIDLVYERYALWGRTATAWALRHGVRSLVEVNAPLIDEQRTHRVLVDEAAATAVGHSVMATADGVSCVSEGVAAWVRGLVPHARVAVVPNGVDTRRITPAAGPVVGAHQPMTVGFVGTLKPWHGVEHLLDAVALLRADEQDVRCLVVGDGPQATGLDALAESLGIASAVERTGAVAPEEIPALLRRMDVATAPYPGEGTEYFSPLKVYEYLAAGLPVIASTVGSIPALLEHGRWGELVAPGDPRALASAIANLRSAVGHRQQIRDEAPGHARRHDWDHVLATSLEVIDARLPEGALADVAR
ncbi:glycosyltransferase family 4 protein [Pseudactinotalea sp.]|uniref:glycosyltransferase family 4 protein n=1 Tax=Pseudactinotalea sp. TaxID=1926260 RepID=UPI003B3A91DF